MKAKLTAADYEQAATRLNVSVPTVRAVTAVESGGAGFTPGGQCIIRFEPHLFSKKTGGEYDKAHPKLSFRPWKPGYPAGVSHSWELFSQAAKLNANAAVYSTSWGLFQILGMNFAACDCNTLGEFVTRMEKSEGEQLTLFCNLIEDWGLDDELRNQDWAAFARTYNGALYRVNKYDTKLATAYARYGGQ